MRGRNIISEIIDTAKNFMNNIGKSPILLKLTQLISCVDSKF